MTMHIDIRRVVGRLILGSVLASAGATALVWACGPYFEPSQTAAPLTPPALDDYARGALGIVKPSYARRYLVHAYRILNGGPQRTAPAAADFEVGHAYALLDPSAANAWAEAKARVLGEVPPASQMYRAIRTARSVPGADYQFFDNCLDESFAHAVRTLDARARRFGAASAELREWTRGQDTVFQNCGDDAKSLAMPPALPSSADALLRADRAYQQAAAAFYGMQFDDAATRFATIARDQASPWRIYGRYLVGRTKIRQAMLSASDTREKAALFAHAEAELDATLADPAASALHASARGLKALIEDRARPVERLRGLMQVLSSAPAVTNEFREYTRLMDRFVGDTVDYEYADIRSRHEALLQDEVNAWVLAFQGKGPESIDRVAERWRATRSRPWLVAALWKLSANHPAVPDILSAASAIEAGMPGAATIAMLRVRLLTALGRRDEARAVLASWPRAIGPGVDAETLNFFTAQRMMLATTFDEVLANAARAGLGSLTTRPVFDADAGDLFTFHVPLDRLYEAARSPAIPDRLKIRLAGAVFSRAFVLGRHDLARQAATALGDLVPTIAPELERYLGAVDADARQRAGILLFLRLPGLHASVVGLESDGDEDAARFRTSDHLFGTDWWCVEDGRLQPAWTPGDSVLMPILYGDRGVSSDAFLSPEERAVVAREQRELGAIGNARDYFAGEAIKWAKTRPTDSDAAEALARVVTGGRWVCSEWALSQQAFQLLHKLFPASEWARRTRYWYRPPGRPW